MQTPSHRVVFLGTPEFAGDILDQLIDTPFEPILVVTEPDKPAGRGHALTAPAVKRRAQHDHLPLAQPQNHKELFETIQSVRPDVIVVVAYGRMLRPALFEMPPFGTINMHPSLLPKYRGATPIQAALLAGDQKTGITIMRIDEGLDTGPILCQQPVTIEANDTLPVLGMRLAKVGGSLLVKALNQLVRGELVAQPQTERDASVTQTLTKNDGKLIGNESTRLVERMLRAYQPWPGVWLMIDDQRILVLEADLHEGRLNPRRLQLAGKNPVDWEAIERDRPELAEKISRFFQGLKS